MQTPRTILRVAVPSPLYTVFDYLAPAGVGRDELVAGVRVRVPFGRTRSVGVLLETTTTTTVADDRLRTIEEIIDPKPVLSAEVLALVRWASDYYHYPLGEAVAAALPVALRGGRRTGRPAEFRWVLTPEGRRVDPAELPRAPRQVAVLKALAEHPDGLTRLQLRASGVLPDAAVGPLQRKGWIVRAESAQSAETRPVERGPRLNAAQAAAVDRVKSALDRFGVYLLDGVTGSGKTEVYLRLAEAASTCKKQVLVLVPEIGLTPQLVERFRRRLAGKLVLLHSGLADSERLRAWERARSGEAMIVLGTRSAVFTPLARPGLLIVDEEHDNSFKQQEGFRYSARDLMVWRARQLGVPLILGSATPSLESLYNVQEGRYTELSLPERVGEACSPAIRILDVRGQRLEDGLSEPLLQRVDSHLAADGQVMLFLNRRGYAPTVLCHDCGWSVTCPRCDVRMVLHRSQGRMHCHHCGSRAPLPGRCGECGGHDLRPVGQGTERVEQALLRRFPEQQPVRIDRDSTRRKGSLEEKLELARSGEGRLLLGTQMLAKGHHFPGVTLVGILDADAGLYSADFRADERMAQLIVQVAGRAGRAQRPGEVCIQTHNPDHPLLQKLVSTGYAAYARAALAERKAAELPPYAGLALLRAESTDREAPWGFLEQALALAEDCAVDEVALWGPVPAPMERRAGRYRAQLMVHARRRSRLQRLLSGWIPRLGELAGARRVRWSIDVDPVDTY